MNVRERTKGQGGPTGEGERQTAGSEASADDLLREMAATAPQEEVARLLVELRRAFHRAYVQQGAPGPVEELIPLMRLLIQVAQQPGVTVSELGRTAGMPKSEVSVLMARAVRQGLVTRAFDATDQRLVRLHLTVAGQAELERWRAAHRLVLLRALQGLPPAELGSVTASMRILLRALQRDPEPGPEPEPVTASPPGHGEPAC